VAAGNSDDFDKMDNARNEKLAKKVEDLNKMEPITDVYEKDFQEIKLEREIEEIIPSVHQYNFLLLEGQ
jgi:hypothetical protein